MLFRKNILQGIASGHIDTAFRRWKRPGVHAGTSLKTAIGIVAIDEIEEVDEAKISEAEAQRAGFSSLIELEKSLRDEPGAKVYRIRLHYSEPDPRIALREQSQLLENELDELRKQLDRFDQRSRYGKWTRRVLVALKDHPSMKAGDLAILLDVEKEWLKINIRKLKNLGLTESLGTGYRLSPRGQSLLRKVGLPC